MARALLSLLAAALPQPSPGFFGPVDTGLTPAPTPAPGGSSESGATAPFGGGPWGFYPGLNEENAYTVPCYLGGFCFVPVVAEPIKCVLGRTCAPTQKLYPPEPVAKENAVVPVPAMKLGEGGRLRVQRACTAKGVPVRQENQGVQLSHWLDDNGEVPYEIHDNGTALTINISVVIDAIDPYADYRLCWCGAADDCSVNGTGYMTQLSVFKVVGVSQSTLTNCYRGQPCSLRDVGGVDVGPGDRLLPIQGGCVNRNLDVDSLVTLGIMVYDGQEFYFEPPQQSSAPSFEDPPLVGGGGGDFPNADLNGNIETDQSEEPGMFNLCYCKPMSGSACTTVQEFRAHTGYMTIIGPYTSQVFGCMLGFPCKRSLMGVGLSRRDSLIIQTSCQNPGPILPTVYHPADSGGHGYDLGTLKLKKTAPGTSELCWCAGGFDCEDPLDFMTLAGTLSLRCPPRYFIGVTNKGNKACKKCDLDNYCPGSPGSPRIGCPGGATTNGVLGAWLPQHCLCSPGFYAASGNGTRQLHCLQCPAGRFAFKAGQLECQVSNFSCVYGGSCLSMGPVPDDAVEGNLRIQKPCGVSVNFSVTSSEGNATFIGGPAGTFFGFGAGRVQALPFDSYTLCWCNKGLCTDETDFRIRLGKLRVEGPVFGGWTCTLGEFCMLENVKGVGMRGGDRIFITHKCGWEGEVLPGFPADGMGNWTFGNHFEFLEHYSPNLLQSDPGLYQACFCRPSQIDGVSCTKPADFIAHVGYLTALGPNLHQSGPKCTLEGNCHVQNVRGVGLNMKNRVMLMKECGMESCATSPCQASAPFNRPSEYMLDPVSLGSLPATLVLCWCSDVQYCTEPEYFNVEVAAIELKCPQGKVNQSGVCAACCVECFFYREVVSVEGDECLFDGWHLLDIFGLLLIVPCLICVLITLIGLPVVIKDIECDGKTTIITTSTRHLFLGYRKVPIQLMKTTCFGLDGACFRARAKSKRELYLLDQHGNNVTGFFESSRGELRVPAGLAALYCGWGKVPFIAWTLGMMATTVICVVVGSVGPGELSVIVAFGLIVAGLSHSYIRKLGHETPIMKACESYKRKLPAAPQPCERGAGRALQVEKLLQLYNHFQAHIRDRNMYYICPNIVKPLTKGAQLSFAEVAGPNRVDWFVSHFWGMPFKHFTASLEKHAQGVVSSDGSWKHVSYWVCTFANNQWHVADEVGASWDESSFYKALRSGHCQGTAMVLDAQALPLTRSWCLFEVLQTALLDREDEHFQGLLLCTSTGVLNRGSASMDVAAALGRRLSGLRVQDAEASVKADKVMIDSLVESMPGGFDAMNDFVHDCIRECLIATKEHFDDELTRLCLVLTSCSKKEDPRCTPMGHKKLQVALEAANAVEVAAAEPDAVAAGCGPVATDTAHEAAVSVPCEGPLETARAKRARTKRTHSGEEHPVPPVIPMADFPEIRRDTVPLKTVRPKVESL